MGEDRLDIKIKSKKIWLFTLNRDKLILSIIVLLNKYRNHSEKLYNNLISKQIISLYKKLSNQLLWIGDAEIVFDLYSFIKLYISLLFWSNKLDFIYIDFIYSAL